jgi:protein-disulfide isomerase
MRTDVRVLVAVSTWLAAWSIGCAHPVRNDRAMDPVVGKVDGRVITLSEVDGTIAEDLFELRRHALSQVLSKILIGKEAERRGVTRDQLMKSEVESRVPPASEEDIKAAFEARVRYGQAPAGQTLESAREDIAATLMRVRQRDRAQAFIESLRADFGAQMNLPEPVRPRVAVQADGPSLGPMDAPVVLVEFSDFQCPFCAQWQNVRDEVVHGYGSKVRVVFRNYPLPMHPGAAAATEAATCAHEQGKFWEFRKVLFESRGATGGTFLSEYAAKTGLDEANLRDCLSSGREKRTVEKDIAAGKAAGVGATPTIFVNGLAMQGALSVDELRRVIDNELGQRSASR